MLIRKPIFALVAALGVGLGGCMQSTLEPASEASMKPRDKELLANAPYAKANIPEQYQRLTGDDKRASCYARLFMNAEPKKAGDAACALSGENGVLLAAQIDRQKGSDCRHGRSVLDQRKGCFLHVGRPYRIGNILHRAIFSRIRN